MFLFVCHNLLWVIRMFPVLLILLMLVILLLLSFRMVFADPNLDPDPRHISSSEQYQAVKDEILSFVDNIQSYSYEAVEIQSKDGLRLQGKLYVNDPKAPFILGLHGYRSCPDRDCSGIFKIAQSRGMNLLLPDMRAHSRSQGNVISLGINERYDCRDWVDYILSRFGQDCSIVLFGCSMGAATVMMSCTMQPSQVKGLICDCGYSSIKGIFYAVAHQKGLPPKPCYLLLKLSSKLLGRFDIEECSSVASLSQCQTPALFIHGTEDRFVPYYMAQENYDACASSNKRLLSVPGAGHGMSIYVDESSYTAAVNSFLDSLEL